MSVVFNSKSGGVEGDDQNLMVTNRRSKNGCQLQSSVWLIGAAAVCVGLLLLAVIMVAHNTRAITHWDTKYDNLIHELIKDRDALKDEQTLLKIYSNNLTKELETLQSQYNAVAANRDKLQEEVNWLTLNITAVKDKTCSRGWTNFSNKCYYFSSRGAAKTWENSRADCQKRGGDLVIVTSKAELDFVTRSHGIIWIGLYRNLIGDKWTWVDETDLVGTQFWQKGEPNNNGGNEHCVEASQAAKAWNDAQCDRLFSWVCED